MADSVMSDGEDIVVTLDYEDEEESDVSTDSHLAVEELAPIQTKARAGSIPIPHLRTSIEHMMESSSSGMSASPSSAYDMNASSSSSGVGGGGGGLETPGRKSSQGVEARVFASEAEHKAYKRMKALEEIIVTERAYVKSLEIVNKYYLHPLKKILTPDEITQIFINLPTLLTVNKTLLVQLEERYLLGSDCCLGDVFLTTADYLKFYTTYTVKHTDALVVVRQLKQRNAYFGPFLKKMQAEPQCQNTYLTSFLIKPVQRICKYPLLIRELIKYTPEGHNDLEDLRAALDKVNSVAEHLNKHHLKAQNISKMMEIQHSLTGIGKRTLLEPGRVFKLEADLNLSKSLHRKGVRKFFLFNDILIIAKLKKDFRQKEKEDQHQPGDNNHSPRKGIYEVKVWLPLTQVLIRDIEDTPATKNVFELWEEKDTMVKEIKKSKSKNWVVYARAPDEKTKWISSVEKYKRKLQDENDPTDSGHRTYDSKTMKMPRSKSSRQLQRGVLKMISFDGKTDKAATIGGGEPRRGTAGDTQNSKMKTSREGQLQEGEDCQRLGLSPRGRSNSPREMPAYRKGLDLSGLGQAAPSPSSSPAQLCSPGAMGTRTSGGVTSFSASYPILPNNNWASSSSASFAPITSSSVASPPESPRSLGNSTASPAPRRKSRRLSAAISMSPSGAAGGLISSTNSPNSTPRRFRLFSKDKDKGGGGESSGEQDLPTLTSTLSMRDDVESGGEEEAEGGTRRRGISFTRRSQKKEKLSFEKDEPPSPEDQEKDSSKSAKIKRTSSFIILGSRLDKKSSESGSRKRSSGKDDSDTKPASGSGKARRRSQTQDDLAKAPPSGGSEGSTENDDDEHQDLLGNARG